MPIAVTRTDGSDTIGTGHVARCLTLAEALRQHIHLAIRAFVRLEIHRLRMGVSWFEAKTAIVRSAIQQYLAHPQYLTCSRQLRKSYLFCLSRDKSGSFVVSGAHVRVQRL